MNPIGSPADQELPAAPSSSKAFRFSLKGMLIFVALVAAIVVTTVSVFRHQQPWVETIGNGVLRTNAPSRTIGAAKHAVIARHQNYVVGEDGKQSDPSYIGKSRNWSVGPSPGAPRMKVTRGKTQITDKNSVMLSIESISVTDTPTLVFIEYDNPTARLEIVNELLHEFVERGVKMR